MQADISEYFVNKRRLLACDLKHWAMCLVIYGNFVLSDRNLLACRLRNWACARQYTAISCLVIEVC